MIVDSSTEHRPDSSTFSFDRKDNEAEFNSNDYRPTDASAHDSDVGQAVSSVDIIGSGWLEDRLSISSRLQEFSEPSAADTSRVNGIDFLKQRYEETQSIINALNGWADPIPKVMDEDKYLIERLFSNRCESRATEDTSSFDARSESIDCEIRKIIREMAGLRYDIGSNAINYRSYLLDLAYYDRWASVELQRFLKGNDNQLSRIYDSISLLPVGGWNGRGLISELLCSLARLQLSSSEEVFRKYCNSNLNEVRLSALRGTAEIGVLPEFSEMARRDKNLLFDVFPLYSLVFEISRSNNQIYLPSILDLLKAIDEIVNLVTPDLPFSNDNLKCLQLAVTECVVRLTNFSFGDNTSDTNIENWLSMIRNASVDSETAENRIEEYFDFVIGKVTEPRNDIDLNLNEPRIRCPDFLTSNTSYFVCERLLKSVRNVTGVDVYTLMQFGPEFTDDIISHCENVINESSLWCVDQRLRTLFWALINMGDDKSREYLAKFIEREAGHLEKHFNKNVFLNINNRYLKLPFIDAANIHCPFVLALYGTMLNRSKICLPALKRSLLKPISSAEKILIIYAMAFIEPSDDYIQPLIVSLRENDSEEMAPVIVHALVLHSGHTFGSPQADSDPTAWEDWWNTPAESRVR
ncbi:MAG: hypothetical protein NUW37_08095 [Planctomycetes bacterium]|nr:hypothetical protein [Planctomycetota bacterium]